MVIVKISVASEKGRTKKAEPATNVKAPPPNAREENIFTFPSGFGIIERRAASTERMGAVSWPKTSRG